jgi:hypothetical protein
MERSPSLPIGAVLLLAGSFACAGGPPSARDFKPNLPPVNPLELIGLLGLEVETTDDYDRWRASLPPGAYAASRRWVQYAALETLAAGAAAAWLTRGLSLPSAGLVLRQHLRLEAEDLRHWTEYHGVRLADLKVRVTPVYWEYTVHLLVGGPVRLRVPHLAFSVHPDESPVVARRKSGGPSVDVKRLFGSPRKKPKRR